MRKMLFLSSFVLASLFSTAQTIECSGTYMVIEPKYGIYVKDCNVCVNEQYAEIYLFDEEVVVPVYETKHMNVKDLCGTVYYIDESLTSYIYYGTSEDTGAFVVSLVNNDGRWTFVRYIKVNQDEKRNICETN